MEVKSKVSIKAIMIFFSIFILIMGSINVYAADDTITLTNVEIVENSDTVEVDGLNFEGTSITNNIVYHNVGDYVKYKITIQNEDSLDYKIKAITDNNKVEYVSYEYSDYLDAELNANSTVDFYVTVTYSKEVEYSENNTQDLSVSIAVTMEDEEKNIVVETIDLAPQTGDSILGYVIILALATLGLVVLTVLCKKNGKKVLGLVVAVLVLTPVAVKASASTVSLSFENKVLFKDKVVLTYSDVLDNEKTEIYKYGETIPVPEDLVKEGYDFLGWYNENDEKVEVEIENVTADTKLLPKWTPTEYTITYDLQGGEAETVTTYTIESEDIVLPEATREGYTFDGWTGDNGEVAQKEVTIPTGSMGDKLFTANWTPVEYKIEYELDGGKISEEPKTYTIESDDFTLPIPTKDEYVFTGWTGTDLEDATEAVTITKGSIGDRKYTATWKEKVAFEVTKIKYPSDQRYTYFGSNDSGWKSSSSSREPYNWKEELPCLIFEKEISRVRLGFSLTEYVTYNNQNVGIGFISLDHLIIWFSEHYGYVQNGYYTLGITQEDGDHEIRLHIADGEIVEINLIY